jgi:hypothetical protein
MASAFPGIPRMVKEQNRTAMGSPDSLKTLHSTVGALLGDGSFSLFPSTERVRVLKAV